MEFTELAFGMEIAGALQRTGQFRVLQRLPIMEPWKTPFLPGVKEGWKKAVIIDTETTGLDTKTCKIIEIALLTVYYDGNLEIRDVGVSYEGLQDPGEPLSDEVKRVTGLDDEKLKGQKINWAGVTKMLLQADLIIAHNAAFDRPILDRAFNNDLVGKHWACSMADLPWKQWNFPSTSLTSIATHLGYFFEAHRAMQDVQALVGILDLSPPVGLGHHSLFERLVASARRPSFRIFAIGSPFHVKDALKARGYHWDAEAKVWFIDIKETETSGATEPSEVDAEMIWLREYAQARPTFTEMTAKDRYK